MALPEHEIARPDLMREKAALSLVNRNRAEFHAETRRFSRMVAIISPRIETAISAGLTAPISSPIGA